MMSENEVRIIIIIPLITPTNYSATKQMNNNSQALKKKSALM